MQGHKEMLPGHSSLSVGRCLHLVLEKSTENPNLSERTFALSKIRSGAASVEQIRFLGSVASRILGMEEAAENQPLVFRRDPHSEIMEI